MTYQAGETSRIQADITNVAGEGCAPATVCVTIKTPGDVIVVDDFVMTTDVIGVYYYDYLLSEETLGEYKYFVKAVGGEDRITISSGTFDVVAAI